MYIIKKATITFYVLFGRRVKSDVMGQRTMEEVLLILLLFCFMFMLNLMHGQSVA